MEFMEESGRIYAADKNGKVIAEILFPDEGQDAVRIERTYVDESLRGLGIAAKLMESAAASAKRRGKKIVPVCSYAVSWLSKHPEYKTKD